MKRLAAVAVLLAGLAGCSGGAKKAGDGPTRQALPPHQALDAVVGDAQRELVRERRITPAVTDRLRAIYGGPELGFQLDALARDLGDGLAGYRPAPGDRATTVSRLISATDVCVFAEVRRDYTAVTDKPEAGPVTLYVALVPKDLADDANRYNPTPWAMFYDGAQNDGSQPPSPCG